MHDSSRFTALALAAFLGGAASAAGQQEIELNQAQQLVFMENHLQNVPAESTLTYAFQSERSDGETWRDQVRMKITGLQADGGRDLEFDFLSGPRHIDFSPASDYFSNPVIIHFLERDISEMARETGGWIGYFRNRIRESFAQPLSVMPIQFSYQGKQYEGTEVIVEPFAKDENVARANPSLTHKRYSFSFSEQLPGEVYRIQTEVPGQEGKKTLIRETLTFMRIDPHGKGDGHGAETAGGSQT